MHGSRGRRRRLARGRRAHPALHLDDVRPSAQFEAIAFEDGDGTTIAFEDIRGMWDKLKEIVATEQRQKASAALRTPPTPKRTAREKYLRRTGQRS